MNKVEKIIYELEKEFPSPTIELNYGNIFQLLVAVILSAQCTDERVNKVTPALFKRYPQVKDFAEANLEELEKLIYSTGFYKNKAKNIKATANMICNEFNSSVPSNMQDLLKLPGVARKTANVILSAGFDINEGIVVDTHVCRIAGLLGWVDMKASKKKDAIKIEKKLIKIIPKKYWGVISYLLILHGRKTCIARRPKCNECKLNKLCPSAKL